MIDFRLYARCVQCVAVGIALSGCRAQHHSEHVKPRVAEPAMTITARPGAVLCLNYSADGTLLASGWSDKTIVLWQAKKNRIETDLKDVDDVYSVAFSPDGLSLISGTWGGSITFWTVTNRDGNVGAARTKVIRGGPHIALSPRGDLLAFGGVDHRLHVWDIQKNSAKCPLSGQEQSIRCIAFSARGNLVVTGSDDRTVRMWDAESCESLGTLATLEQGRGVAECLAVSHNGNILAVGTSDGNISVWDLGEKRVAMLLEGDKTRVNDLSFSPNDALLVSVSGEAAHDAPGAVRIWDIKRKLEIRSFFGHDGGVRSVAFSPDGKQIATGGCDGILKIWNVDSIVRGNE